MCFALASFWMVFFYLHATFYSVIVVFNSYLYALLVVQHIINLGLLFAALRFINYFFYDTIHCILFICDNGTS